MIIVSLMILLFSPLLFITHYYCHAAIGATCRHTPAAAAFAFFTLAADASCCRFRRQLRADCRCRCHAFSLFAMLPPMPLYARRQFGATPCHAMPCHRHYVISFSAFRLPPAFSHNTLAAGISLSHADGHCHIFGWHFLRYFHSHFRRFHNTLPYASWNRAFRAIASFRLLRQYYADIGCWLPLSLLAIRHFQFSS
jgi:hypothetical protein